MPATSTIININAQDFDTDKLCVLLAKRLLDEEIVKRVFYVHELQIDGRVPKLSLSINWVDVSETYSGIDEETH